MLEKPIYYPREHCRIAALIAASKGADLPRNFLPELSYLGGDLYLEQFYQAIADKYYDPNITAKQAWKMWFESWEA